MEVPALFSECLVSETAHVQGICFLDSLELTTAAELPLGKTGNDSTFQLPAQTGNRQIF